MVTLLVIAFETESGAGELVETVRDLQKLQLITLADAADIVRSLDGSIKVSQVNSLVGAGALGGAFWGLFAGLLLWQRWADQAPGSSTAVAAGVAVGDCGLDRDFVDVVVRTIGQGHSALILLVDHMTEDKVMVVLTQPEATILRADLSRSDQVKLRKAFGVQEGS